MICMKFSVIIGIAYRNLGQDWYIYRVLFQKVMWFFQISVAINKSVWFQVILAIANQFQNISTLFKNEFLCVPQSISNSIYETFLSGLKSSYWLSFDFFDGSKNEVSLCCLIIGSTCLYTWSNDDHVIRRNG